VRRHRTQLRYSLRCGSRHNPEEGVVISLVAVFMLFVVGAMAALSIDVVTMYTARSEAQLAADAAALAGARVLANSGMTSYPGVAWVFSADNLAKGVAVQVAEQSQVGGTYLTAANVLPPVFGGTDTNPTVTVKVQITNLPTFFARIWGTKFVTVGASATAEAYNPLRTSGSVGATTPVAPTCVKPWLLPNIDPTNSPNPIFDPVSGAITAGSNLLGWSSSTPVTGVQMSPRCGASGNCAGPPAPARWSYYPGDDATFPHPNNSLPTCSLIPTLTDYQKSIVGCIQTPISCNRPATNIDISNYPPRNAETADAVNCLTHAATGNGDTVTTNLTPPPVGPFEFVAGADNPVAVAYPALALQDVMVSDSLVTVPVFDTASFTPGSNTVTIVGFVQLFLNPDGAAAPPSGDVSTTVINIAGCGTGATGTPILGNGASPVAVRLISP